MRFVPPVAQRLRAYRLWREPALEVRWSTLWKHQLHEPQKWLRYKNPKANNGDWSEWDNNKEILLADAVRERQRILLPSRTRAKVINFNKNKYKQRTMVGNIIKYWFLAGYFVPGAFCDWHAISHPRENEAIIPSQGLRRKNEDFVDFLKLLRIQSSERVRIEPIADSCFFFRRVLRH